MTTTTARPGTTSENAGATVTKGLGRVPKHFKDWHKCGKCGEFLPLWDLAFARWCDGCVRDAGGLLKAGEIATAQWKEAHPRPTRPRPRPEPTVAGKSAAEVPAPARNAKQWQRAQSLHKAMNCTPEEAYDRLNAADAARKVVNENVGVS